MAKKKKKVKIEREMVVRKIIVSANSIDVISEDDDGDICKRRTYFSIYVDRTLEPDNRNNSVGVSVEKKSAAIPFAKFRRNLLVMIKEEDKRKKEVKKARKKK